MNSVRLGDSAALASPRASEYWFKTSPVVGGINYREVVDTTLNYGRSNTHHSARAKRPATANSTQHSSLI